MRPSLRSWLVVCILVVAFSGMSGILVPHAPSQELLKRYLPVVLSGLPALPPDAPPDIPGLEIAGVSGKLDPLSNEGKAELSLTFQAATAFIDSTGYCLFIAFPILDIGKGWEGMAESVAGVTGLNITGADVVPLGKEVLKMERLFNEKAGFTAEDDRPPEFMLEESLPPHNVKWTITNEQLDSVFAWVHDGQPA